MLSGVMAGSMSEGRGYSRIFDRLKAAVFLHGSLFLTSRHGLYNIFSIAPVPSHIVSEFNYIACPVMHNHEVVNKGALLKVH